MKTLQQVTRALGKGLGETIVYAEDFGDITAVLERGRDFVARVGAQIELEEKRNAAKKGPRAPKPKRVRVGSSS